MRSRKLSQVETDLLRNHYAANARGMRAFLEEHKSPPPFDLVFEQARNLCCFPIIFGAWVRAMGAPPPDSNNTKWEQKYFLYLYRLGGDAGLGDGDDARGKALRLSRMKQARNLGDLAFINAIKDIQRHRPAYSKAENADRDGMPTRNLILGSWLPLSLWAMDDKSALAASCSLKRGHHAFPSLNTWRQHRYQLSLTTWRDLGLKSPLLEFVGRKLRPTPLTIAGDYFLGRD